MHALIIGAAGMIGRKIAERLARDGALGGRPIDRLTLVDIVEPVAPAGFAGKVTRTALDLAVPGNAASILVDRPEVIFHLAAVVSGEAEADLEKGYAVNLDGTRNLLDAIRLGGVGTGWVPRFVYASSTAVFGGDIPDVIDDDCILTPQTSYGAQKAMGELFVADYSRRGFIEGVGIRLPTICVRPGKPNKAASGFFSGIIREPLNGQEAILPVGEDVRHCMASPRSAVGFFLHAATLDTARLGFRRSLIMPALSVTVGEQIAALERAAGPAAVKLIRRAPDPTIEKIVRGWAKAVDAKRAHALGFRAETTFDEIVRAYIEEEKPTFRA